jgi:hypothetical protein
MFYDRGTVYLLIDHCVPLYLPQAGMEAATESTNPLSPIKLEAAHAFPCVIPQKMPLHTLILLPVCLFRSFDLGRRAPRKMVARDAWAVHV